MDTELKEISVITFGVLSAEDIRAMSAFQVTTWKISNDNLHGTVHDPRSGPIGTALCQTCNQTEWGCPGHFGHIELNTPVLHPLFLGHAISLLNIFCYNCHEFLLTRDHLELNNILKLEKEKRFNAIVEKIKKCDRCIHCSAFKAEYKIGNSDITYKTIYRTFPKGKVDEEDSGAVSVEVIKKLFDNIKPEHVEMLSMSHPKNYCLTVFPVIPLCCRPHEVQEGNINDDDLTYQLMEIVKNNNAIGLIDKDIAEGRETEDLHTKRIKYINNLKFRIETYCNNSKGKATHATTGKAIKGIRERLTGKEGQIRVNLLGKRCEMSGRTVIGPDPNIKIDEVGVPREIANSLSVPEIVSRYNKEKLTEIVNRGEAIRIITDKNERKNIAAIKTEGTKLQQGDLIHRREPGEDFARVIEVRDTKFVLQEGDKLSRPESGIEFKPVTLPTQRKIELKLGQTVERYLRDGDIVLLNRQPTLHKGSMMAHKIKITNTKTIMLNPANTKSYNADFDGDEMNLHVPQSIQAQVELRELSTPKHCLISAQAGKPNLTIVQDSLTGAYLMSSEHNDARTVSVAARNDIMMILSHPEHRDSPESDAVPYLLEREREVGQTLRRLNLSGETLNGRGLLSLLLPRDLSLDHSDLKITRGVIHHGSLTKKYLSSTETSLIKVLYKEYSADVCATFIENIQYMTNKWLETHSFSIHAGDCIIQKDITRTIDGCLLEAEKIRMTTKNPFIMETKIAQALSNTKDIGMKIVATDGLIKEGPLKNNFLITSESGSKGDLFNICQITGLLGQQNIQGRRIKPTLNNKTRSLPHYPIDTEPSLLEEYEASGYISSSFAQGLTPREFIFHCCSGRMGVIDTSLSTASSGYNMRRTVKLNEDIKVQHDGTVQDAYGRKFQMAYGGLGYDPAKTVKINGKAQICNVGRLVDRLNDTFERNAGFFSD